MKLCHLEIGSRSTRATIVSGDRAMSLIASPSLWLGALAGLASTWTVPFIQLEVFPFVMSDLQPMPKPSFCVIGLRTLHDPSVEYVAAIDHQ
jgi:hypothetical protein